MPGSKRLFERWRPSWRLSLFEKVIFVNSVMLIGEALAGLEVTSHSLESHHYLIDTSFIVGATVLSLSINIVLLRSSFRPLFSLLQTIRIISTGRTRERALSVSTDTEIGELAQAFNTMLDTLETLRRNQTMLILQAQEEERRRVALELHDESSQNLTALLVHTEILQQGLAVLPATAMTVEAREQMRSGLSQLTGLTQRTLESIRTLALQLRPAVLDDLGLQAALRWLAEDCRQRLHLEVELHLEASSEHAYPPLYETTLFRVAQESLTNVARHAHATHVSIELVRDQSALVLRVQDNGEGYVDSEHVGLGITGMRDRVALLNGTFQVRALAVQGTVVETHLPLPVPEEASGSREVIKENSYV